MPPSSSSALGREHPAWSKKARSLANELFIVRSLIQDPPDVTASFIRYGIVVKKKLGGAVVRNRIKRRLRAAFQFLEQTRPSTAQKACYIVVVRQASVAHLPFSGICDHLKSILKFYA
jgi:ribonuclease P protein component